MALRARLVAPPPAAAPEWRWHNPKTKAVPARFFLSGERRLAARTFLSPGFGVRQTIEASGGAWDRFEDVAEVVQPPRTKAVLVPPGQGTPFLIAGQLFDVRPTVRKWLASNRIRHAEQLFAKQGTIIARRSADVGRATVTCKYHEGHLISDHFFRIEPRNRNQRGWLYAFALSNHGRAIMLATQYGHIIQHIEFGHLNKVPVPRVSNKVAADLAGRFDRIVELRNSGFDLSVGAESEFAHAIGTPQPSNTEHGFEIQAVNMLGGRRRLEAAYHAPEVTAVIARFAKSEPLGDVTKRVWWMTRFKRVFGDGGLPYASADDLFCVNPPAKKRILVQPGDSHEKYFVERDWIVMACSGQVYGLNGAAMLMTPHHEKTFFSHDLIRIIPDLKKIRAGYLLTALTHPTLGRPVLIREAYGTSIPHLDPGDVARFPVVRLDEAIENRVADLAEQAALARAEADEIERAMAAEADEIIERFIE
jgi:type I restriction enzyme, S subunit